MAYALWRVFMKKYTTVRLGLHRGTNIVTPSGGTVPPESSDQESWTSTHQEPHPQSSDDVDFSRQSEVRHSKSKRVKNYLKKCKQALTTKSTNAATGEPGPPWQFGRVEQVNDDDLFEDALDDLMVTQNSCTPQQANVVCVIDAGNPSSDKDGKGVPGSRVSDTSEVVRVDDFVEFEDDEWLEVRGGTSPRLTRGQVLDDGPGRDSESASAKKCQLAVGEEGSSWDVSEMGTGAKVDGADQVMEQERRCDVASLVDEYFGAIYENYATTRRTLIRQARDVLVCDYQGCLRQFEMEFCKPAQQILQFAKNRFGGCRTSVNPRGWPLSLGPDAVLIHLGVTLCPSQVQPGDGYLCLRAVPKLDAITTANSDVISQPPPGLLDIDSVYFNTLTSTCERVQECSDGDSDRPKLELVLVYADKQGALRYRVLLEGVDRDNTVRMVSPERGTLDTSMDLERVDTCSAGELVEILQNVVISIEHHIHRVPIDDLLYPCPHCLDYVPLDDPSNSTPPSTPNTTGATADSDTESLERCTCACQCVKRNVSHPAPKSTHGSTVKTDTEESAAVTFEVPGAIPHIDSEEDEDEDFSKGHCAGKPEELLAPRQITDLPDKLLMSGINLPGTKDLDGRPMILCYAECVARSGLNKYEIARLLLYYSSIPEAKILEDQGLMVLLLAERDQDNAVLELMDRAAVMIATRVKIARIIVWQPGINPRHKSLSSNIEAVFVSDAETLERYVSRSQTPNVVAAPKAAAAAATHAGATPAILSEWAPQHDQLEWAQYYRSLEPFIAECRQVGRALLSLWARIRAEDDEEQRELGESGRRDPSKPDLKLLTYQCRQMALAGHAFHALAEHASATLDKLSERAQALPGSSDVQRHLNDAQRTHAVTERLHERMRLLEAQRTLRLRELRRVKNIDLDTKKILSWFKTVGDAQLKKFCHDGGTDDYVDLGKADDNDAFNLFVIEARNQIKAARSMILEFNDIRPFKDFNGTVEQLEQIVLTFQSQLDLKQLKVEAHNRLLSVNFTSLELHTDIIGDVVANLHGAYKSAPFDKVKQIVWQFWFAHARETIVNRELINLRTAIDVEAVQSISKRVRKMQDVTLDRCLDLDSVAQFQQQLMQLEDAVNETVHCFELLEQQNDSVQIDDALLQLLKKSGNDKLKQLANTMVRKNKDSGQTTPAHSFASGRRRSVSSQAFIYACEHRARDVECTCPPYDELGETLSSQLREQYMQQYSERRVTVHRSVSKRFAPPLERRVARRSRSIEDTTSTTPPIAEIKDVTPLCGIAEWSIPEGRESVECLLEGELVGSSSGQAGGCCADSGVSVGGGDDKTTGQGHHVGSGGGACSSCESSVGDDSYDKGDDIDDHFEHKVLTSNSHLLCSDLPIRLDDQTLGVMDSAIDVKTQKKLLHVIGEMIDTERAYVGALDYVIVNYIPELSRDDIPQSLRGQSNVVFGNVEGIHAFHSRYFLRALEQCSLRPLSVGHVFLQYRHRFGLYALYNKNKPKSDELMTEHGSRFFKDKQSELQDSLDLASYLLKPVQRMTKYALLLKELLKPFAGLQSVSRATASNLNISDRSRADLKCIREAEEMVSYQLRHGNDLLAMDSIRECNVNLKEQGALIRQSEFVVHQARNSSHKSVRHIFLFEELILFAKPKRLPDHKNLDFYMYKSSFKTADIGLTMEIADTPTKFEIWYRKRKKDDTYVLQAASEDMKRLWTEDLAQLLWKQAIKGKEEQRQEMSSMGIGNKPCLDIRPSSNQINDRAIPYDNWTKSIGRGKVSTPTSSSSDNHSLPTSPPLLRSISSDSATGSTLSSSSSSSLSNPLSPTGLATNNCHQRAGRRHSAIIAQPQRPRSALSVSSGTSSCSGSSGSSAGMLNVLTSRHRDSSSGGATTPSEPNEDSYFVDEERNGSNGASIDASTKSNTLNSQGSIESGFHES